MSGEPHTSSAPTRADEKRRPKEFSPLQKLSIVCGVITILGGGWFFFSGQAASTIDVTLSPTSVAETLTTNPTLETGLVGHWTFDGMDMDWSSTTAEVRDRSGQGNHGSARDMSTQSGIGGVLGQGLNLDGLNDRFKTSVSDPFEYTGSGSITGAVWAKRAQGESTGWIISKPWNGVGDYNYALKLVDGGYLSMEINNPCANSFGWVPNVYLLPHDTWTHLTFTIDSTNFTLYVNGIQYAQVAHDVTDWSCSGGDINIPLTIGSLYPYGTGWGGNTNYSFDGSLDDVRIYNRTLSAEEVKRLYGLGATTHIAETITTNPNLESGLVGHWTFDGDQMDWSSTTAEVRDRSGQGNNGDAIGSLSTSSVVPGVLGQGLDFTKNGVIGDLDYISLGSPASLNAITDAVTVAGWIYMTATSTYNYIFSNTRDCCGAYAGYELRVLSDQAAGFTVWDGATSHYVIQTPTTLQLNDWYHVAGTFDGATLTLYINGVLNNKVDWAGQIGAPASYESRIGALGHASGEYDAQAKLDDVRVYNRALSAEEVGRLYQLGQ